MESIAQHVREEWENCERNSSADNQVSEGEKELLQALVKKLPCRPLERTMVKQIVLSQFTEADIHSTTNQGCNALAGECALEEATAFENLQWSKGKVWWGRSSREELLQTHPGAQGQHVEEEEESRNKAEKLSLGKKGSGRKGFSLLFYFWVSYGSV